MRRALVTVLLVSLYALSGCGLKGNLYLPPPKPAPAAAQPAASPADQDDQATNGAKPAPKPQ